MWKFPISTIVSFRWCFILGEKGSNILLSSIVFGQTHSHISVHWYIQCWPIPQAYVPSSYMGWMRAIHPILDICMMDILCVCEYYIHISYIYICIYVYAEIPTKKQWIDDQEPSFRNFQVLTMAHFCHHRACLSHHVSPEAPAEIKLWTSKPAVWVGSFV
jgi:hypothetical protein